jgi:hypothetical protein
MYIYGADRGEASCAFYTLKPVELSSFEFYFSGPEACDEVLQTGGSIS